MRSLLVFAFVAATAHQAHAEPAFEVGACELDLRTAPGTPGTPRSLDDLPHEHGEPPPEQTRLPLIGHATATATASRLLASLPKAWVPRVELDSAGMASVVELRVPGSHTAAELAPSVLAFVRAHPCLFGVVDPSALSAHANRPAHDGVWILIDVPVSIGAIAAEVEAAADGKTTQVRIDHHLWPIADPHVSIDPAKLLARYLGLRARREVGSSYLVDPKTHRHLGCVPIMRDGVTDVSTFSYRPGPILVCHAGVAEVTPGAYVWIPGMTAAEDSVLQELPAALDPSGARLGASWISPVIMAGGGDDLGNDVSTCGFK